MPDAAICAHNLVKQYGDVVALAGVDLTVVAGSIYALLGPNGAGKTTMLSILTTLIPPTDGHAEVAGYDVVKHAAAVRERIGVTFQDIVLDKDLPGRTVLDYHGRLYRLSSTERRDRIAQLVDLVQLNDAIDRSVKTYSGGMKRRLELARGLMTDPAILFLDEPTQGLDPQNRAGIWEYIRTLNRERGLTVLLTTHYMDEAEHLAHTIGIIDHGKMVIEGTPHAMTATLGTELIRLSGSGNTDHLLSTLQTLPFVQQVTIEDAAGSIAVYVDSSTRRLADVVAAVSGNGFQLADVSTARPGLDDVFLHYTGRVLRD